MVLIVPPYEAYRDTVLAVNRADLAHQALQISGSPRRNRRQRLFAVLGDWHLCGPYLHLYDQRAQDLLLAREPVDIATTVMASYDWHHEMIDIIESYKQRIPEELDAAIVDLVGHLSSVTTDEDWYSPMHPMLVLLADASPVERSSLLEAHITQLVSTHFDSWLEPTDFGLENFSEALRWHLLAKRLDDG